VSNYFKSNLKFLREEKGLSKNKLSEMTGVNQTTIGRWENGEISPTIDNVIDLMNALNVPLSELGTFLGKDLTDSTKTILPKSDEGMRILKEKGLMDENDNVDIEKLNEFNKKIEAFDEFSSLIEKFNKNNE